jgi:hypothetical protein
MLRGSEAGQASFRQSFGAFGKTRLLMKIDALPLPLNN